MVAVFNTKMTRADSNTRTSRQIPEEVVADIIKDAEQESVVLQLANIRRMNAYQTRMRILDGFPDAYWINGDSSDGASELQDSSPAAKDSALKQTTKFEYTNAYLTPEELAVLVVMPDNWLDDSDQTWDEVRVALRTAFAKAIDKGILYNTSAVGNLPPALGGSLVGLVPEAIAAGNVVESGADLGLSAAELAELMDGKGYPVDSWLTKPGLVWKLRRLRDTTGQPIYGGPIAEGQPNTLYGYPIREVRNGVWPVVTTGNPQNLVIAGDWSNVHVGIRKDMTFSLSDSAVIRDQAGAVQYSAFQQDGVVLRAVMRIGYTVTTPLKHMTGTKPFPLGVLRDNATPYVS